ncbi:hypothetical protein SH2C18_19190 [Clostridium sediminicola]
MCYLVSKDINIIFKYNITLFYLQHFKKNSKELNKLRAKVKESWDLVFDLVRYDEYVNGDIILLSVKNQANYKVSKTE